MPKYIVKINNKYLEWSTVVDAPVTYGMTFEKFKKYYIATYGSISVDNFKHRIERVDKYGTSDINGLSLNDLISGNRAGKNEAELSLSEIEEKYC